MWNKGMYEGAAWVLAGNIVYAVSLWSILMVIARVMDAGAVGQYALGLAVCAPVIMFGNMRLRLLLAADADIEHGFSDYLHVRYITALMSFIVVMLVAVLGPYSGLTAMVILVLGMAKAIESITDLHYGLFQKVAMLRLVGVSQLLKAVITLAAFYIVIMLTENLIYAVLVLLIVGTSLLLFYVIPAARKILQDRPNLDKNNSVDFAVNESLPRYSWFHPRTISLVSKSLPLGFVALLGSLLVNIPRYFVEALQGSNMLGVYASMSYFGVAGLSVAASLMQPVLPKLSSAYNEGNFDLFLAQVKSVFMIAFGLGVSGFVVVWYQGGLLLGVLYGDTYSQYSDVFSIIMIAIAFNYIALFQYHILTAMGELKMQLILILSAIISLVTMCMVLVPDYGIMGAAIAETISMMVHAVLGAIMILHLYVRARRVRSV